MAWRWINALTPQDVEIAVTSYRQRFGVEPDGVMYNPVTPDDVKRTLRGRFRVCRENTLVFKGEFWLFAAAKQMSLFEM
jgi:hypothetical protein